MKIEKLPSGSYRIRQMYKGTRYTVTVEHKPTPKEAAILMAEKLQEFEVSSGKASMTFGRALDEYIQSKINILSPATIRGYRQLKNMYSKQFLLNNIYDLRPADIQLEVNLYASAHSAKSVKNFHGLISAFLKLYRPNMVIATTLPKRASQEAKIPTHEDVLRVLNELKGTEYSVAIQLACLGLRRSEIVALDIKDLDGNKLTINKAKVVDANNKLVTKSTKTVSSTRAIYIPDSLADEIRQKGYIYKGYPNSILRALHRTQDKLGVPKCKFHELRHFYVSYAHSMGMSDTDIIASIGHKTDGIMKRVYRHAMNEEKEQIRIANSILQ